MRTFLITAAFAATIPCGMALAQPAGQSDQTTVQTTVTPSEPAAPSDSLPPAPSSAVPPAPPTSEPAAPPSSPPAAVGSGSADVGAAPGGVQFAPSQEIVESAPPAPKSYPLCTRTLRDSCKNPNPGKELPYYRHKG